MRWHRGKITWLDSRHRRQTLIHHLVEHAHYFVLTEQPFANQVFGQQCEELCTAVALEVLEFGQGTVDLAGRAETGGAMGILRGHWHSSLIVIGWTGAIVRLFCDANMTAQPAIDQEDIRRS